MDYKLYVEQYLNGNSCCMFNDLKISKKKNKMRKATFVTHVICVTIITLISACCIYFSILHDKYILVQHHYILFTIIYQLHPLSLSFPPISYLFIFIQTQYYPISQFDSKDRNIDLTKTTLIKLF